MHSCREMSQTEIAHLLKDDRRRRKEKLALTYFSRHVVGWSSFRGVGQRPGSEWYTKVTRGSDTPVPILDGQHGARGTYLAGMEDEAQTGDIKKDMQSSLSDQ